MTAVIDAGTAVITCRDGNHTLALTDREVTAERLIKTSRKHSFDPDTDVDWDAPPVPGLYYASSATHAGGGVCGIPGMQAARAAIADRKTLRRRGRRP